MILKNLFKGVWNKVMIALAGLTMVFGVGAAVSNVVSTQQNEVVETKAAPATTGTIRVYVDSVWSGWSAQCSLAGDSWGGMTSTDNSNGNYYKEATGKTGSSNAFYMYFVNSGNSQWAHPYSGNKDWDTNYSTVSTTLSAGHAYKVTIGSVAYNYDSWEHQWVNMSVTDLGAFGGSNTVAFDPKGSFASWTTPYVYFTDADGVECYSWPGKAMTKGNASIYGGYRWTYTGIPTNASLIIFSNNGSPQTGNLTASGNFNKTYVLGSDWQSTAYTLTTHDGTSNATTKTYLFYSGLAFNRPTPTVIDHYDDTPAVWAENASLTGTTYAAGSSATKTGNYEMWAKYTPDTYTITFYQNDGTGFSRTATKIYGVAFTIPAPGEDPISDMGASGGRKFLRWDTNSKGDGTSYSAGASYTADASLELYMIQDWYTYEYSTNGGSTWNALVKSGGDTPTGYVAQFEPESDQTFTSGTVLTFRRYYGEGAKDPVSINEWQGGNYDTSIIYGFTGKIYLKVTSLNVHDVVVEGYSQRSIAITRGGVTTMYHMAVTDTTHFYTDEPVEIYPGDVIQGVYNHEDTHVRDTYKLANTTGDGSWTGGGDAGDVVSRSFGVFVVTLFGESVSNVDKVSFTVDVSASAILFAQVFNSEIGTVCTGIEGGSAASGLVTPWGRQKSYFDGLVAAAQTAVKSDLGSSNTDVVACRAKYDQVCGKYGPNGQAISGITDFMGRNPKPKTSGAGLIPGAPGNNQSPLTTTLWIVFGCGLAGLGAIGTAYFVSKKKKKNHVA